MDKKAWLNNKAHHTGASNNVIKQYHTGAGVSNGWVNQRL